MVAFFNPFITELRALLGPGIRWQEAASSVGGRSNLYFMILLPDFYRIVDSNEAEVFDWLPCTTTTNSTSHYHELLVNAEWCKIFQKKNHDLKQNSPQSAILESSSLGFSSSRCCRPGAWECDHPRSSKLLELHPWRSQDRRHLWHTETEVAK